MKTLRIGYLPLTDAALLHVAAAKHFDREEGVVFALHRETSWANLRDKLAFGFYEAAHMLAPAVLASALGLDGFHVPMIGAAALGLDGNAISVSPALAKEIAGDPTPSAKKLAALIADEKKPRFAHVFPWSMHHYQLLLWLRLGGLSRDQVSLTVTPPPLIPQSIEGGYIDGFCVGEPWNTFSQQRGASQILFPCLALMRDCPEKVLAFPRRAAEAAPDAPKAAARALRRAALWGEANIAEFRQIVADSLAPDLAEAAVRPALEKDWLRLDAAATGVSALQAEFLLALLAFAGQAAFDETGLKLARAAFWTSEQEPPAPKILGRNYLGGPLDLADLPLLAPPAD
ncbi:NitT/TauT family transport system ATP-binding protein [Rhodoblastus acidophilus]|uniref:ABC transporter substrate-binding protein n=1 Tax=Rhodoblastus acidophilus TaxID=1074 RepID=UPI002225A71D|nr:ABC transporter substrate-binding protein [Rhodoblastus acidophilus]MCW2283256.1 NitT/TauT family transport system ATP-binding protein [Rhodoblastus acidophilus]MCW2332116.1 NitT/TauT family transport system ATP-binding protein [Rhodoblastus acidophilus]